MTVSQREPGVAPQTSAEIERLAVAEFDTDADESGVVEVPLFGGHYAEVDFEAGRMDVYSW